MNKWRSFLLETKRKHPMRARRVPYDHTATKYTQQNTETGGDPRSELKYFVSNLTYHAADSRSHNQRAKDFIQFMETSEEKDKLIDDLKLIHYMFTLGTEDKYAARGFNGSLIFDDTGPLAPNSDYIIEDMLDALGEQPITHTPNEMELDEIFKYYIAPSNKALWPDAKPEPAPSIDRFSQQRSFTAADLERMNRELRNKRRK